jgi:hypothetical protein
MEEDTPGLPRGRRFVDDRALTKDLVGEGIATALLGVTYFFSENSSDGV